MMTPLERKRLGALLALAGLAILAYCDGGHDDDSPDQSEECQEPMLTEAPVPIGVTGLTAFHRSGQTFLTWPEDGSVSGESYRIYRSYQPITSGTLAGAALIAAVPEGSGIFTNEVRSGSSYQTRYILEDLGPELPEGVGLHVHTTREADPVTAWYAVTMVQGGGELPLQGHLTLVQGVTEARSLPRPVAVWTNGLKTLYTHWMDYAAWNPRYEGYAYNFWVGLPPEESSSPLPLQFHLHAWGESWHRYWSAGDDYGSGSPYGFQTLWIEPDDNRNTWWYGFANNVARGQPPDDSSILVNYTEQRLLYLLRWITSPDSPYLVDRQRIYLFGGSMGGSGTLSFGLRHPEWFAAMHAVVPMTDPGASSWGRDGFNTLWGTLEQNLPTNEGTPIWERMNSRQYLLEHAGEAMPYAITLHGREDTTIEWPSQGLPWVAAVPQALAPGPVMWANSDHSNTYDLYQETLFPNYVMTAYTFRRDESYLVFTRAPGDDDPEGAIPACRGTDPFAYGYLGASIEWASSGNPLLGQGAPIDTSSTYQVALRLRSDQCGWPERGTVTVAIHRAQAFRPGPGAVVAWENRAVGGGGLQSGVLTLDARARLILPGIEVNTAGSLLTLTTDVGGESGDADGDSFTVLEGDCDDLDAEVRPDAVEVCDGKDNDCDGERDEEVTGTWFVDADGDGWGGGATLTGCVAPDGYVAQPGDCDDTLPAISPGAGESCDGIDNDCDGIVDEGTGDVIFYRDLDGDGYGGDIASSACAQPPGYSTVAGDCDDAHSASHPGAAEACDGADNDCDGEIDDGLSGSLYYRDQDSDGYGTGSAVKACAAPPGHVSRGGDCNDRDVGVNPGATDWCDGIDNNCDGEKD